MSIFNSREIIAMSIRHPIIAITGSSGAGTTSVTRTFENIFRRENIKAAVIEGDSFHRYDRKAMKIKAAEAEAAGDKNFSHFGPTTNLFPELAELFRSYGETGTGKRRKYLHDLEEAAPTNRTPAPLRRGKMCLPTRICCSTKGCMARWSHPKSTLPSIPTC
jgi:phosphoribulokinase